MCFKNSLVEDKAKVRVRDESSLNVLIIGKAMASV
jgi:hypothetical protein